VDFVVVIVVQYWNTMQDDYRRPFRLAREANRPENALYTLYFTSPPITTILILTWYKPKSRCMLRSLKLLNGF